MTEFYFLNNHKNVVCSFISLLQWLSTTTENVQKKNSTLPELFGNAKLSTCSVERKAVLIN